jgi:4,5-dihydroxyphthalate decarboxylase
MKILIERQDLGRAAVQAAAQAEPQAQPELVDIKPAHRGFRTFLTSSAIDVSELAIVTLLQAVAYDMPVLLLPIVTLSRDQHQMLVTLQDRTVRDTEGATIGVRSWSQTTGVWVRGFMAHGWHVDLQAIDWVVYEAAHVPNYRDPPWVRRAAAGHDLEADFAGGQLDYAIFGSQLPGDSRTHSAFPDADLMAEQFSSVEGYVPVNHVVATTVQFAAVHAEAICAVYDAMASVLVAEGANHTGPAGFEALRGPFLRAAQYAFEQAVLPRRVEFDELVARTCEVLGVSASRLGG